MTLNAADVHGRSCRSSAWRSSLDHVSGIEPIGRLGLSRSGGRPVFGRRDSLPNYCAASSTRTILDSAIADARRFAQGLNRGQGSSAHLSIIAHIVAAVVSACCGHLPENVLYWLNFVGLGDVSPRSLSS